MALRAGAMQGLHHGGGVAKSQVRSLIINRHQKRDFKGVTGLGEGLAGTQCQRPQKSRGKAERDPEHSEPDQARQHPLNPRQSALCEPSEKDHHQQPRNDQRRGKHRDPCPDHLWHGDGVGMRAGRALVRAVKRLLRKGQGLVRRHVGHLGGDGHAGALHR